MTREERPIRMTDEIRDDKQYREIPEDGHVLLLMETGIDQKTFTDYPNLVRCLDGIMDLYEHERVAKGQDKDNYDINKLWNWIDEFKRVDLFVYDTQLGRYKKNTHNELKQHFINQIEKLQDSQ